MSVMDTAYIETTIIGTVACRLSSDPALADRQKLTRQWWGIAPSSLELVVSQLVIDECNGGDPTAAKERMEVIGTLGSLVINESCRGLAAALIDAKAVPKSEPRDALHIGISAVHGVQYLVTWNFKHIANAVLRSKIESVCRDNGFEPPVICTPQELQLENSDD